MTQQEVAKLLAMLKVSYPQAATADPVAQVRAWMLALEDLPYEIAEVGVLRHIKRSKWHPTPAEIRDQIADAYGVLPDESTAWGMVRKHISSTGYINPVPFAGSSVINDAVRAVGGWRALRMSESPERDRDAFCKAYRAYRERALGEIDLGFAVQELAAGEVPVAAIGS